MQCVKVGKERKEWEHGNGGLTRQAARAAGGERDESTTIHVLGPSLALERPKAGEAGTAAGRAKGALTVTAHNSVASTAAAMRPEAVGDFGRIQQKGQA